MARRPSAGVEYRIFRNLPASLRDLYDQARKDHGEKDFLVYEDARLTYAEAWDRAAAISHQLVHRYGVGKGDRVAIGMRNCPEWVIAFMAITSCGAISVSLNGWWSGEELEYGLRDSGAKVVFLDEPRHERLAGRLPALDVRCICARLEGPPPDGVADFDALRREAAGRPMPDVALASDDDVMILFSSGTTGFPKGALSTHRAILSALANWGFEAAVRIATGTLEAPEEDPEFQLSVLMAFPLFHVGGSHASLLPSFGVGRKVVMMYRWDPERALDLIERERITAFLGVPTMTWELLHSPSLATRGSPEPRRGRGRRLGESRRHGGAVAGTAAGPALDVRVGHDRDQRGRHGQCGRGPRRPAGELRAALSDHRAHAHRRRRQRAPAGRAGRNGPQVGDEHARLLEPAGGETAETIRDGWLRTGDIAEIDEEGYVYIRDRAKDMVVRGGENIYSAEVERVVYLHPAVFEAAAFGVPDERLGEELAVVVMRRPGAGLDAEAVRTHVAGHLARFKVPRYVWLEDEPLPRLAAGKIDKRALRDRMLREGAELP